MRTMSVALFASAFLVGCVAIPAGRVVYRSSVPEAAQPATCQQVAWDGEKWVCTSSSIAVGTETVVIDNVLYGVVGGLIAGYWIGNSWHYGVPRGFVPRHGYHIAPRGYYYVPRGGHVIPRGFSRGGRGRR